MNDETKTNLMWGSLFYGGLTVVNTHLFIRIMRDCFIGNYVGFLVGIVIFAVTVYLNANVYNYFNRHYPPYNGYVPGTYKDENTKLGVNKK